MSFMEKNEGPNPTLFQLFSSEIRFWRVIARIHKPLVTGVRVSIPFIGPVGFVLNSTCKIRYFARGKLELVAASERLTRPRGRAAPTYGCTERVCHGFATAQPRNHNISILILLLSRGELGRGGYYSIVCPHFLALCRTLVQ